LRGTWWRGGRVKETGEEGKGLRELLQGSAAAVGQRRPMGAEAQAERVAVWALVKVKEQ
jgi:hypothetical protein